MDYKRGLTKKDTPFIIKIISAFDYILSPLVIILSVFLIIDLIKSLKESVAKSDTLMTIVYTIIGIPALLILIGIGITSFFVAKGLLNSKKWAKTCEIIKSSIFSLFFILQIFNGNLYSFEIYIIIISLIGVVHIIFLYYLTLNSNVKKYFL